MVARRSESRALMDSRKAARKRAVAIVLSTVAALSCLPFLSAPRVGSTRVGGTSFVRRDDDAQTGDGGEGKLGLGVGRANLESRGGGKLRDGTDRCFVDAEGFQRCYPNVFFFGTSKCATTSLAQWLDKHPSVRWLANPRRPHEVEVTGVKESHVFDDKLKEEETLEAAETHDKLYITSPETDAGKVVIDYTPHYIAVAEAPHRIADLYGGEDSMLKFIVTLREPVSRTISSWQFKNEINKRKGRKEETRTLAETIGEGRHRGTKLHACLSLPNAKAATKRMRDLKLCNPRDFLENPMYVSHVGKSMYAIQLERWFSLFGRDKFKVVFMDEMAADPVGVLKDIFDFLEIDFTSDDESKGVPDLERWKKITGRAHNKTTSKKKAELDDQVTDEIKDELREFFKPHNQELEELLGVPLPQSWSK